MLYNTMFAAAVLATSVTATAPEQVKGMKIKWSDDFKGTGAFNKDNWGYYKSAIANNEVETYPPSGDYCKLSGKESLMIHPTKLSNGKWESCRIETSKSWAPAKGGKIRFQSRFKLGKAGANLQGIWPAFWSLGDSMRHGTAWPECGEIDTFETVNAVSTGYGTLHCGSSCHDPGAGLQKEKGFDYGTFHTWAHEIDRTSENWQNQTITWTLDGVPYHEITGHDLVAVNPAKAEQDWITVTQKPFYITLNVAVGGTWPGKPTDTTASGKDAGMEVQYVAVYES